VKLTGRNVVVTGGTSGIGFGLVTELARRGNTVLTCGRNPQRLARLRKTVPSVIAYDVDLATADGVTELMAHIETHFDVLDILINNAGVSAGLDLNDIDATADRSAELIAVNVTAPVRLTIMCIPMLERSAAPAVVNVSSIVAHVPKGRAPVYAASKAAIRAFTIGLRAALADSPIEVFDVLPPLVESAMAGPVGMERMDAVTFARIVIRGMERGRLDIRTGRNRWIVQLNRVAPKLADRLVG